MVRRARPSARPVERDQGETRAIPPGQPCLSGKPPFPTAPPRRGREAAFSDAASRGRQDYCTTWTGEGPPGFCIQSLGPSGGGHRPVHTHTSTQGVPAMGHQTGELPKRLTGACLGGREKSHGPPRPPPLPQNQARPQRWHLQLNKTGSSQDKPEPGCA